MTQIVSNIIQNSLSGFVAGAASTVGEYAGGAIAGLGNFVEQKGDAVGDGIAKKFDGWGQGIAGYGGRPKTTSSTTRVVEEKKTNIGQKKQLPSSQMKNALQPASSAQKRLPDPAKPGAASKKSVVKPAKPQLSRVKSDTAVLPSKRGHNISANKSSTALTKPKTTSSGKVIPDKRSLPQNKPKTSSTSTTITATGGSGYKGPIPLKDNKSGSKDFKPNGGYQGPLNLSGITGTNNNKTSSSAKPVSSNSGMKVGTGQGKTGDGGYKGPLKLGSLA